MPFDIQANFEIIAFVSLWLSGPVMVLLARHWGFSRTLSFLALPMFYSLTWLVKYNLFDFWLPDGPMALLMLLGLLFIVKRSDLSFLVLLLAAVAVKEAAVILIPLFYTLTTRRLIDVRLLLRTMILSTPALALLIGLHILIVPGSETYAPDLPRYDLVTLLQIIGFQRSWAPSVLWGYTAGAFGALLLLALFAPRRNFSLLVRFSPLVLFVYLQLFLAADNERLIVAAFPFVILAAQAGCEQLGKWLGISPLGFLSLLFVWMVLGLLGPVAFGQNRWSDVCLALLGIFLCLRYALTTSHRMSNSGKLPPRQAAPS